MRRVLGLDGEDRMPLDADPLSDAELATLRGWIAAGAVMPAPSQTTAATPAAEVVEHWAYVKPVRPPLPAVARAGVDPHADRSLRPRAARTREAWHPSPEADRRHAAAPRHPRSDGPAADAGRDRRVPRRHAARTPTSSVVDRLLASPHYGERWARPWLDLARYADTNGYEKDRRARRWKYRDWVIDALNRDMPFDHFTVEQIAGDMLPDATDATADRHRLPSQHDDQRGRRRRSRRVACTRCSSIASTRPATVWLGTTLGCAQCHNHKYDPVQPEGLLTGCWRSSPTPTTRRHVAGDGTRFVEAKLDLATPEQDAKRARRCRPRSSGWKALLAETTPELAERQARLGGGRSAPRTGRGPSLTPRDAQRDRRRRADRRSRTDRARVGAERRAHDLHHRPSSDAAGAHRPAARGAARPVAAARRPGPRRLRPLPRHRPACRVAPARRRCRRRARRSLESRPRPGDDAASADRADDCAPCKPARPAVTGRGKRGPWSINAMRETPRRTSCRARHASAPFGFAGGTRVTLRIDQRGRHDWAGSRPLPAVATTAARSPGRRRGAAALRPVLASPPPSARSRGRSGPRRASSARHAAARARARGASTAARRQLVDLADPVARWSCERRPRSSGRPTSLRERGASRRRASGSTPARRGAAADERRRCRRTGSAWRAGWSTATTR